VDVRFRGYEKSFPVAYGIEGIRTMTGSGRPFTCTALPQGSSVDAHPRARSRCRIDGIKDDHGIANQQATFERRVAAVQKAINEANRETGGNTVYAPTFSGGGLCCASRHAWPTSMA
jgi:ribulose-bisphosphate carboxylase large chain